MPAQQRVGLDEKPAAAVPGEHPRNTGEQGSVGRLERWTGDLAAKDCHFVTQNDDPEGKPISVTAPKGHRLGDAEKEQVEEPQRHLAILAVAASNQGRPTSAGTDGVVGTHRLLGGHREANAGGHGRILVSSRGLAIRKAAGRSHLLMSRDIPG